METIVLFGVEVRGTSSRGTAYPCPSHIHANVARHDCVRVACSAPLITRVVLVVSARRHPPRPTCVCSRPPLTSASVASTSMSSPTPPPASVPVTAPLLSTYVKVSTSHRYPAPVMPSFHAPHCRCEVVTVCPSSCVAYTAHAGHGRPADDCGERAVRADGERGAPQLQAGVEARCLPRPCRPLELVFAVSCGMGERRHRPLPVRLSMWRRRRDRPSHRRASGVHALRAGTTFKLCAAQQVHH